jgi:hypothetical protein
MGNIINPMEHKPSFREVLKANVEMASKQSYVRGIVEITATLEDILRGHKQAHCIEAMRVVHSFKMHAIEIADSAGLDIVLQKLELEPEPEETGNGESKGNGAG